MTKHDDRLACLESARDLIASGWTQGAHARNGDGWPTYWGDPAACKWCLTGAIARAAKDAGDCGAGWTATATINLVAERLNVLYGDSARDWRGRCQGYNDTHGRTADEVLDMLDHVIATERLI